jgi:hypothetical protein
MKDYQLKILQMKKHILLIGITLSILLLTLSAAYYPGGSQHDKNSVGYDFQHNYLCNLFNEKAVNGVENPARFWAIGGMLCLCVSMSLFFVRFSEKIPNATSAKIIKYCGVGSMFFALMVATPYHDLMTTLSSVTALFAVFYMTVAIFKSKRPLLKWLSGLCLAVLYANNYIYYTQHWLEFLPILQKISFLIAFAMILSFDYLTTKEDFFS